MVFHDLAVWSKWADISKSYGPIPQSLEQIVEMCNVPVEPNLLREFGSGGFFFFPVLPW